VEERRKREELQEDGTPSVWRLWRWREVRARIIPSRLPLVFLKVRPTFEQAHGGWITRADEGRS